MSTSHFLSPPLFLWNDRRRKKMLNISSRHVQTRLGMAESIMRDSTNNLSPLSSSVVHPQTLLPFKTFLLYILFSSQFCRGLSKDGASLPFAQRGCPPPSPRGETSNGRRKCFPKLLHFSYITLLVWRTCWRQSVEMKCPGFFSIHWLCAPLTNIYAPSMANENRNAYCVATTWWLSFLFCYDVKQLYFKDKPSNYV